MVRAWYRILLHPRQFFAESVPPADQAPGLLFAAAVVLIEESTRLVLVDGAAPVLRGQPTLSAVAWVLAAVLLIAPAAIHLTAAVETLVLMAVAPDRGGVSQTVQVICYSMAPCVLAGIPNAALTAVVAAWSVGLVVFGTSLVHEVTVPRATVAALVPAAIVFGVGFRGIEAGASVLESVIELTGGAV